MRSTFCLAAALLATNVYFLDRSPELEVIAIEMPVARARHPEADRLAWLRAARYAGFRLEGCDHADPVATLDADIDSTPGREHVVGNRQHGVAMFAETGELLAMMRGVGCHGDRFASGDQSLSISADGAHLILRTRRVATDGEYLEAHVVERRGDELVTLATVDIGGARTDWDAYGKLYIGRDEVEVKMHGRRSVDGTWIAVDEHRTYALR